MRIASGSTLRALLPFSLLVLLARCGAPAARPPMATASGPVAPASPPPAEGALEVKVRMTPLEASQMATINGAEPIGWSPKTALIAVDGDPPKDVTTLEHETFVMKGVVYKNEYC